MGKAIEVLNKYEKQFGISEPAIIEKAKLYSKLNDVKEGFFRSHEID